MWQPKQVRSYPLHNAAVREVLQTVCSILEIAKPASSPLLESPKCGPAIEQGVEQSNGHPGGSAGPGLA